MGARLLAPFNRNSLCKPLVASVNSTTAAAFKLLLLGTPLPQSGESRHKQHTGVYEGYPESNLRFGIKNPRERKHFIIYI